MATPLPISIDNTRLRDFCCRWRVSELSLFGSVLRADFKLTSDVDVLVRFDEGACPSLFGFAAMQQELEGMLGRRVDLTEQTSIEASDRVARKRAILESRRVLYAA